MGPQPVDNGAAACNSEEGEDSGAQAEVINMEPPPMSAPPQASTQVDSLVIDIVEARDPKGNTYFSTIVKRNGKIVEKYTSGRRPVIRELVEDEYTDLNREKRNLRVADELKDAFNPGKDAFNPTGSQ
jgi:hypothetical protein